MGNTLIWIYFGLIAGVLSVPLIPETLERIEEKRSIDGNGPGNFDYPDYATKYDEYPVVVPKRAALLLDQLMVALQKVVDNQQGRNEIGSRSQSRSSEGHLPSSSSQIVSSANEQTMDLQRRGQGKGPVYWRCYFNAVTCFKRK